MISIPATSLLSLTVALVAAWGVLALRYQAPRGAGIVGAALWTALGVACIGAFWCGHLGTGVAIFALAHGLLLIWWKSLRPSNDREWADDVAQTVGGTIDGDVVTLDKVRDFDWRSSYRLYAALDRAQLRPCATCIRST